MLVLRPLLPPGVDAPCLPKEASADRRSGHPPRDSAVYFPAHAFGTKMHFALNHEPLSFLPLA